MEDKKTSFMEALMAAADKDFQPVKGEYKRYGRNKRRVSARDDAIRKIKAQLKELDKYPAGIKATSHNSQGRRTMVEVEDA